MGQLAKVEAVADDFESAMFQPDAELPKFVGLSWEEHISAWASVKMKAQDEYWRLAAIAHSVQLHFGADSLRQFAQEVGLKSSTIYKYARTYRRFSNPECERSHLLDFSVHTIAAYQKTTEETVALLEQAEQNNWSAETVREYVRRESFKKRIPDAINPDDEYDRLAWERDTRPVLYRFVQKCPKFKRQVQYLIGEIDGWFKTRTAAPIELIARAIKEGCETADLIAEEVHMVTGAVQILLDDLVAQGKVRERKELKVTHDARGATRKHYSWIYHDAKSEEMYIENEEDDD